MTHLTIAEFLAPMSHVWGQSNGHGRGDGYDVDVYRSGSGRYVVRVYHVSMGRSSWYVASTLDAARRVGAAGYTPGTARGAYRYVSDWRRLREARTTSAATVSL